MLRGVCFFSYDFPLGANRTVDNGFPFLMSALLEDQYDVVTAEDGLLALEAAQSGVESAIAGEAAAKARLDRLLIKAPVTATVLQVKIHKGEYAPAAGSAGASNNLMVLGDIDTLVVRTDVDENDAWRFKPGAEAYAFVRGNRDQKVKLAFVRAEPYVVPKRSLTGESTERVDTRVLQVLYSFKSTDLAGVYVGQQMDVYIKAAPVGGEKPETTNPATTKTSK